jgi:alkylhydroperoxidase/carboxymuconolactone decarboxylase family protein YurZ
MTAEKEQELERTSAARGFRYGKHDFLAELGVEYLKRHNEKNTYHNPEKTALMGLKTRELVRIAVDVALRAEVPHIQMHMHAAVKAGSTKEEVWELLEYIRGPIGGVTAVRGFEAWRATFRPDIPTIDRVVELR